MTSGRGADVVVTAGVRTLTTIPGVAYLGVALGLGKLDSSLSAFWVVAANVAGCSWAARLRSPCSVASAPGAASVAAWPSASSRSAS